jgi:hypothetical protein
LPETTPLPNVAISDTGKLVQYILDHPDQCLEKTIAFYSEAISEGEKIRSMAEGVYRKALETNCRLTFHSI